MRSAVAPVLREVPYEPPDWLYPKQRESIFDPARFVFIEASTKSGKTVGCIAWLCELAIQGEPGQEFWWVAPIRPQAKIAYRRVKRYIDRSLWDSNESDLRITLANGAVLCFKGSDNPDSLYGEDVHGCVIDEASRCKEDTWPAIRSTLTATRAPCRIIGNVKGRKNWAYKLGQIARQGRVGYAYHKITAADAIRAGVLALDEILEAQAVLTEDVFAELYMAVATEEGANPFGMKAIAGCLIEQPESEPVVWGWDLARKVDWTVGIALDQHARVCRFIRFKKPWPETIKQILKATGTTPALVDATGVGDAIVAELQRKSDANNFVEFVFTKRSKQEIMEGLAVDVQAGEIFFPEGTIAEEMRNFEYEHTKSGILYSAPEGLHDDCVCALAMARLHFHSPRQAPAELW
jgi:phage FluMu gp28-like protein